MQSLMFEMDVKNILFNLKLFLVALFLTVHTASAVADDHKEIRILVLLSLDVTYPYVKMKVDGLGKESAKNPDKIYLDIQSLEDERFTDPVKLDTYYRAKAEQFRNSNPDVIAITGSPVIFSFYNNYVYPLMPDVPMIGETRITPPDHKPQAYSFIEYHQNIPKTIDLALEVVPARTIYLIGDGTHPGSLLSMQLIEKALESRPEIKTERLDMPLSQLKENIKTLPSNAIGLYSLIFSDGAGKRLVPESVLQEIADVSPFPIFAFHQTMVGSGATGGIVAKGEDIGRQMIQESMLALNSGPFNPPRIVPAVSTILFDGKYLHKYNLSFDRLPESAEVINKKKHTRNIYFYEFLIGILLLFVVSVFIMVRNYFRSRREELSRIHSELEQHIKSNNRDSGK